MILVIVILILSLLSRSQITHCKQTCPLLTFLRNALVGTCIFSAEFQLLSAEELSGLLQNDELNVRSEDTACVSMLRYDVYFYRTLCFIIGNSLLIASILLNSFLNILYLEVSKN